MTAAEPATGVLARGAFDRILLIKLSAVGDVVHALPVLAGLRARFPTSRIDWLIRPDCADLVRCHPALSNVVPFPRRIPGTRWARAAALLGSLGSVGRSRYDLVVDLQGQLRSAVFALASRAPVRVGFAKAREGAWLAYSHRVAVPGPDLHAVDRYLWCGDLLGFPRRDPDFTIRLPPEAAAAAEELSRRRGLARQRLAILVPGTLWETKHWSVDGFAAVGRHLAGRGLRVIVAGTASDRGRGAAVAAACPGAVDICGETSLGQLAALIRRATICVTNDSGPLHLAVALGTPVAGAFGPTNPARTGPYRQARSVVRTGVPCSPCCLRALRQCPYDHRCMTTLSAATMIERIDDILAEATGGSTA